ncbi:MAG: tRNA lysidine(34) synthetase TilS [Clostridiales bacterium]|nr:tRNA lysidine(34) synthetase TilS [Clostridiales bacterium]
MNGTKRLLGDVRKACEKYDMIEDGDTILVGVSGGKDSVSLLYAMCELRRFYPKRFDVQAIAVDMQFQSIGRDSMDFSGIEAICNGYKVPFHVEKTDIAEIIFKERKESNPCSLCSRMRRGALCSYAEKNGIKKLALGHHFDDAVETFILNLFFEGRLGCFSPVSKMEDTGVTVIRPLIETKESTIKYFISSNDIEVLKNSCPEDKNSERENIKRLLNSLEKNNKGLKHRIMLAMEKGSIDGLKLQ